MKEDGNKTDDSRKFMTGYDYIMSLDSTINKLASSFNMTQILKKNTQLSFNIFKRTDDNQ